MQVVPDSDGAAVHANWSHDGTMFTWEVLTGDGANVWTAAVDGSGPVERVTCAAAPCVQMSYPSLASDDQSLLLTRYDVAVGGAWGPSHLVLVDLESGEQTIIASTADGTTSFYMSSMSPDGSLVAATLETYTDASQDTRTASEVVVVDTDPATGDPPVGITDAALFAGYPRWHPVDDRILFASWDLDAYQGAEESQLYTIAPDGSGLTQITDVDHAATGRRPGEASWTPDGERIIASMGVVVGGTVVDVKIAYVDPATGEITETDASGAMPVRQPCRRSAWPARPAFGSRRSGEGGGRRAVELEAHHRFVADHPGVVAGLDEVGVAGPDVGLGAVVVHDVHRPGHDYADVAGLAAVTADDRLDALRPPPARLGRDAGRPDGPQVDHLDLRLRGGSRLVG